MFHYDPAKAVIVVPSMQARRQQLPEQLQGLWSDIPAWTATLLFMFQPVAQSVSRELDAPCCHALSVS